ncbi:MAG TPA: AraC family transcriptional regulator [Clostridiaceae bacterium]|nr:AraC family transcriptional regulator [Clostridiaceae bacterium]
MDDYPVLKGNTLFRKGELVYVNRSDELREYCDIVHKHDFIEIAYVIEGSGFHIVGDKEYKTSIGDLFIINYDIPHGFFPESRNKPAPIVYNCVFMPEFLDTSLFASYNFQDITSSFLFNSLFPEDFKPSPDLKLTGTEFSEIGELFSKMYSEYKFMQKGYCDIIRAYLIELIIKVFRLLEIKNEKGPASKNAELISKAIEYMKQNLDSDIKLDDLALKSFMSKTYFSRLFKETTGINFSDYVQQLRIDKACNLLKTTDMKIIDIAVDSGFNDLKFFYKVFKKITGKTPGDFRKGL